LQKGQFCEALSILELVSGFFGGSCVHKGELVGPAETDAGWLGPGKITQHSSAHICKHPWQFSHIMRKNLCFHALALDGLSLP
jgi:hypothetical protein